MARLCTYMIWLSSRKKWGQTIPKRSAPRERKTDISREYEPVIRGHRVGPKKGS